MNVPAIGLGDGRSDLVDIGVEVAGGRGMIAFCECVCDFRSAYGGIGGYAKA